jgi:hypothetical protein
MKGIVMRKEFRLLVVTAVLAGALTTGLATAASAQSTPTKSSAQQPPLPVDSLLGGLLKPSTVNPSTLLDGLVAKLTDACGQAAKATSAQPTPTKSSPQPQPLLPIDTLLGGLLNPKAVDGTVGKLADACREAAKATPAQPNQTRISTRQSLVSLDTVLGLLDSSGALKGLVDTCLGIATPTASKAPTPPSLPTAQLPLVSQLSLSGGRVSISGDRCVGGAKTG